MRRLLAITGLLLSATVNAAGLEFVGIGWGGQVYQFDSAGNFSQVGDSGLSRVNSAAMDADGRFIVANNNQFAETASFYEIDVNTGAATLLATYDFFDIRGLAFLVFRGVICRREYAGASGNRQLCVRRSYLPVRPGCRYIEF